MKWLKNWGFRPHSFRIICGSCSHTPVCRAPQADRRGRQVFYVVGDEHIRSMLADMVDHISEEEVAEGEA